MLGYEGLEVVNPEGGTEDAEAEAQRGRWKQEVHISPTFHLPMHLFIFFAFQKFLLHL